jgi:hypothetical protein
VPEAPAQETPTPAAEPEHPQASAAAVEQATQAQSTSAEQDAIKAQIESFVNQNNLTAPGAADAEKPAEAPTAAPSTDSSPQATDDVMMANAIKGLVSDEDNMDDVQLNHPVGEKVINPPSSTPDATVVAPTAAPTPNSSQPAEAPASDDSAEVAHKKIIAPITEPHQAYQPDLNELLEKEGLGLDDDSHLPGQPTPQNPTGLPTAPHTPGHVISPNPGSDNGVDPNSIAL